MVVIGRFGRDRYVCGVQRYMYCSIAEFRFGSVAIRHTEYPPHQAHHTLHASHTRVWLVGACVAGAAGIWCGGYVLRYSAARTGSIRSVRGHIISDTIASVCDKSSVGTAMFVKTMYFKSKTPKKPP